MSKKKKLDKAKRKLTKIQEAFYSDDWLHLYSKKCRYIYKVL